MNRLGVIAAACAGLVPVAGFAAVLEVTGSAGGGLPVGTHQNSLAITYGIRTSGFFPGGSSAAGSIGEVSMFAGNFAPGGYLPADGRLLPISEYSALFTVLGTTYGGDGQSTFALPDLRGRTAVGVGNGAGLTPRALGASFGSESVTLSVANLPAHSHTVAIDPVAISSTTGGGVAYSKVQPSLAIHYTVPLQGVFPSRNGGSLGYVGDEPVMGFLYPTAIGNLPSGWTTASGQQMSISQNTALFSLLGTFFGGNGMTNFALPDLRGRAAIGAGPSYQPGIMSGAETMTLSTSQLPAHVHAVTSIGENTSSVGGGLGISNEQPTLALNYVIAMSGIFPSRDGSGTTEAPYLGQISLFAGNFAPDGWAMASGQILSIAQNQALFALLGTNFGGNGTSTFALPNLNGTLAVGDGTGAGLSSWQLGQQRGSSLFTLSANQMPAHTHEVVVPEPTGALLGALGLLAMAARRRRAAV